MCGPFQSDYYLVKDLWYGEAPDSEKDCDSDFDSDTYEDPQGDHDDSYEPPPRLEGHMKAFTVSPSITNPRGEYVDTKALSSFQDDYIEPEDETDDDNYIDPTEKTLTKPPINRAVKPCISARANSPDFYEVPDVKQEPQSEDEYEVCDADDNINEGPEETTEARRPSIPTPRPRDMMPLPRQLPSQSRGTLPSDSRAARDAEEDGSYLLRKSSGVDAQQPYTLVVFYNSRVYNIPVRYIASTKQYALGKEKQAEERFSSVSDIIENHQKNPLVLVDSQSNTKDSTKLRHPIKI
ncbi:B-cell linker -like isoform X7 [Labeo rohita]|uniref:B-cell linker-like isoform X7 n=1 Tax=Labeo rohita TaxID=84645 RepID=A0A498LRL3_LABRO|nr:B-cell linker -like isoform X7 [Labeo rohita]